MYLPSTDAKCKPAPLPANFGAAAVAETDLLTRAITAAQAAFNLGVYRPDLGPNGLPWGTTPAQTGLGPGAGMGNAANPNQTPIDITWPGSGPGNGAANPNPANGPGSGPGANPITAAGSASNPRVVETPFCSPITTAQRYVPPPPAPECGGVRVGDLATTMGYATQPAQQGRTPVHVTSPAPVIPPLPTGNVCEDLRAGLVLQSQVSAEQLYMCAQAGYQGVAPSPLGVINSAVTGMGACGSPANNCAGNAPVVDMETTLPLGYSTSPAELARNGGMNSFNWWWLVAAGLAMYAANRAGK